MHHLATTLQQLGYDVNAGMENAIKNNPTRIPNILLIYKFYTIEDYYQVGHIKIPTNEGTINLILNSSSETNLTYDLANPNTFTDIINHIHKASESQQNNIPQNPTIKSCISSLGKFLCVRAEPNWVRPKHKEGYH